MRTEPPCEKLLALKRAINLPPGGQPGKETLVNCSANLALSNEAYDIHTMGNKYNMKVVSATVMIAAMLPLCASAALPQNDTSYLTSAMQTQLGRYALASLAASHASSPDVKSLAKSIATQAGSETRKLDAIATKNGVPVAKSPSVRDSYHYSQLNGLHGKAFDRQFIQELNVDDQIVASSDQSAIKDVKDSSLRNFAQRRYSALKKELAKLKKIKV